MFRRDSLVTCLGLSKHGPRFAMLPANWRSEIGGWKMDFLQYFREAHNLDDGFPLNPSQVEAFVAGGSHFGKGRFNLDPRFTLEMGWHVAALDVDRFCAAVRAGEEVGAAGGCQLVGRMSAMASGFGGYG